ncbi:hypothetical protein C1N70_11195 [Cytobacillus firmus]
MHIISLLIIFHGTFAPSIFLALLRIKNQKKKSIKGNFFIKKASEKQQRIFSDKHNKLYRKEIKLNSSRKCPLQYIALSYLEFKSVK